MSNVESNKIMEQMPIAVALWSRLSFLKIFGATHYWLGLLHGPTAKNIDNMYPAGYN